jgi:hypothetical protein
VWRKRHRLQRLECEIAEGKAERAELRRRLEQFETIAAAAGAALPGEGQQDRWLGGPAPAAPMPPSLLAAARDLRSWDVPVRLDIAGAKAVAIVGGSGDPREWWSAIWQLAGPAEPGPREVRA